MSTSHGDGHGRGWRRWAGYAAVALLLVANAAWQEARQKARDAARLRADSEIKALLYWAALRCGSR